MTEVYTLKELAQKLNVPWQTVISWRRKGWISADAIDPDGNYIKSKIDPLIEEIKNEASAKTKKDKPQKSKPVTKKSAPKKALKAETVIDCDEFIRQYWQKGNKAVDMLFQPQETRDKIFEQINEALKYAYETLEQSK